MSTGEVLTFLRQQGPNMQNASEDDLIAFAAQHPNMSNALDPRDKAKAHLGTIRREAGVAPGTSSKELAESIQLTGEKEQAASDLKARGQFASTMVRGGAVTAATLATGGAAFWPAMAIMAGTGAASSLVGTGIEEATGTHRTMKQRAQELALDTGVAIAGEGIGRGIGLVTKKLLPNALAGAASRSQRGQKFLAAAEEDALNSIYSDIAATAKKAGVKEWPVNADKPLRRMVGELNKLPRGRGDFAGRFGGMTEKAREAYDAALNTLNLAKRGGQIGSDQPLDALIRTKRSFQQYAFDPSMARDEAKIMQRAAEGLNEIIKRELKIIGPNAVKSYEAVNEITRAQTKATALNQITELFVKSHIARATAFAAGGSIVGGKEGAMIGAMAGFAAPSIAAMILEQAAAKPALAATFRQIGKLSEKGLSKPALAILNQKAKQEGWFRLIEDSITPEMTGTPPMEAPPAQ